MSAGASGLPFNTRSTSSRLSPLRNAQKRAGGSFETPKQVRLSHKAAEDLNADLNDLFDALDGSVAVVAGRTARIWGGGGELVVSEKRWLLKKGGC